MKTRAIHTYCFNELTPNAKAVAVEEHRGINTSHEWWDFVYEDSKTIFELCGFTFRDKTPFYFSGFYSQGDGACINSAMFDSGDVQLGKLKACIPRDDGLHAIAETLSKLSGKAFVKHSGRYYHERSMAIDGANGDIEAALREPLADLCLWLYKQLESTYDDLTSNEAIAETLRTNEYEFTEEGKFYG